MKLYQNYTPHFFGYTPRIAADFCGYPLELVLVSDVEQKDPEFAKKKAHHNFPLAELPDGSIVSQSVAIAQFVARESGKTAFIGSTPFLQAEVEQWCSFAQSGVGPYAYSMGLCTFGWKVDAAEHKIAVDALKEHVKLLDKHLADKEWLVGQDFTLADVAVFVSLLMPYSLCLDAGFRKAFPHAAAWFEKVSKLPVVARTTGYLKLCETAIPAAQ